MDQTHHQTFWLKEGSVCANPWVTYGDYSSQSGSIEIKTIDDVETPGFNALRKCGKFLPLNPVDIKTVKRTQTAGSGIGYEAGPYCDVRFHEGSIWYEIPLTVVVPDPDPDKVIQVGNQAIADAKAGVMDALTFLAEVDKTATMLGDLFRLFNKRLLRPAVYARRLAKGDPSKAFQIFSKIWLQGRFGIRPLIFDAEDAIKALQTHLNKSDLIRGRGTTREALDASVTYVIPQSGSTMQQTVTERLSGFRWYRGKAYAEVDRTSTMRFGMDPLVTGYEIVPFSFVFDYFCDMGSYIQAISPFSGAHMLGAMVSVKDAFMLKQEITCDYISAPYRGHYSKVTTELQVAHYSRQSFSASLPGFNPRLTPARVVDLIALLLQGRSGLYKQLR
jgi:hypothetical protein